MTFVEILIKIELILQIIMKNEIKFQLYLITRKPTIFLNNVICLLNNRVYNLCIVVNKHISMNSIEKHCWALFSLPFLFQNHNYFLCLSINSILDLSSNLYKL